MDEAAPFAEPLDRTAMEPRYELRIFGADLSAMRARLQAEGEACETEEREDVYLLCRDRVEASLKLRKGTLDLKLLHRVETPFELWMPVAVAPLPLPGGEIAGMFMAPAGIHGTLEPSATYDAGQLVAAVACWPEVRTVTVRKRRTRYALDDALGEWTDVLIDEVRRQETVAIEGPSTGRLDALAERLGLVGMDNVSYPRVLHETAFGYRP